MPTQDGDGWLAGTHGLGACLNDHDGAERLALDHPVSTLHVHRNIIAERAGITAHDERPV